MLSFCATEEDNFQTKAYEMMCGKVVYLKSRLEACSQLKCIYSQTRFFRTGPGALDPNSASTIWEKKAEDCMKSDSCKNRNDIAVESIDIEWHVCLGDTSVQIVRKLKKTNVSFKRQK